MKIAVVAPSNTLSADVPARVQALAGDRAEIVFHPQCFLSHGHFAGTDRVREDALVDVANDPAFGAVWLARGGYGANRIAERSMARMGPAAGGKIFLGYSDAGFLLAALLKAGVGAPVHGPMPSDILRDGGAGAVARALDFLIGGTTRVESDVGAVPDTDRFAPFNLTVLSNLLGTPLEPDLAGRIVMIEEVDEEMYRIDRMFFHVTSSPNVRRAAGLMLGRCAPVPPNVPDFTLDEEAVVKHWCELSGIPYLGRADIGHDVDNKVVPFG